MTLSSTNTPPRSLWITLEAEEVIELKRLRMDRDGSSAMTFFCDVLAPRVRAAAHQRRIALDLLTEEVDDEHIPG